MRIRLEEKVWWSYLDSDLQRLLSLSVVLIERASKDHLFDYSYIIFPAAKAYEGFLKKMFLDLDFISKEEYGGRRFRVGKALNPELDKEIRHESVYDKLKLYCGGDELPTRLWETWTQCRNRVFHFFPGTKSHLSLEESKSKVNMIIESIDVAFRSCMHRE